MAIDEAERRHLFDRIAEVTDRRAAEAMSAMFDEAGDEDPGILARFDQQDAALTDLSGRMERVEHAQIRFDAKLDTFRADIEGLLHREIGAAIASQTRTVLFGILGVTAAMFAMLLTMNQVM